MKKYIVLLFCILAIFATESYPATIVPSDSDLDTQYKKEATILCNHVIERLKLDWWEYDRFELSDISYSVGGPINIYYCTITATHPYSGRQKQTRVDISYKPGGQQFRYEFRPLGEMERSMQNFNRNKGY